MTTRQLRLLGIPGLQLIANAVEQLDVALLRILLEGGDEGPGHGAGGLGLDRCVGSVSHTVNILQKLKKRKKIK